MLQTVDTPVISQGHETQPSKAVTTFEDEAYYDDEDYDDVLEDEEYDAEDLMASNPADLTKSYNRQRRLNEAVADSNVPRSKYPKSNPQPLSSAGGPTMDDQVTLLSKHASKLRLEDKYMGTYHGRGADKSERATAETGP